jgi:hypothetical protein
MLSYETAKNFEGKYVRLHFNNFRIVGFVKKVTHTEMILWHDVHGESIRSLDSISGIDLLDRDSVYNYDRTNDTTTGGGTDRKDSGRKPTEK